MNQPKEAIVLLSGGQDSTTCLGWALDRYERVETVGFDYGQRHRVELECRTAIRDRLKSRFPKWGGRLGVDHLLRVPVLGDIGETALTNDVAISMNSDGLPNTFVPGRNLVFLTLAAAVAYRRGISVLVGGMCETDFSGYPDCRNTTIESVQESISLGMDRSFSIEVPLMWIDKAATWKLAQDLGGDAFLQLIKDETHTCYLGDRDRSFPWGRGCGKCPACDLRSAGFAKWSEEHR